MHCSFVIEPSGAGIYPSETQQLVYDVAIWGIVENRMLPGPLGQLVSRGQLLHYDPEDY